MIFITTITDVFAHASYKCPVNNCFEWACILGGNCPEGSCPGGNYLGKIVWEGKSLRVWGIVLGAIVQVEIIQEQLSEGKSSGGGDYPGRNFHIPPYSWGAIVWGAVAQGWIVIEPNKTVWFFSLTISFFNNTPSASWLAHITRDLLTCCSCSYYSSMMLDIADVPDPPLITTFGKVIFNLVQATIISFNLIAIYGRRYIYCNCEIAFY